MSQEIDEKYQSLGGQGGFLGNPIGPEQNCSDGEGRFRNYQNGSIFWCSETGAHEVHGAILSRYSSWDFQEGVLGYPISDELDSPDDGRYSRFQNGLIVWWSPQFAAQGVHKNGLNIGRILNFRRHGNTPYGNLADFYNNMRNWHQIDLLKNINRQSNEKRYIGWQVTNFSSNSTLNGKLMNPVERFVLTVARILLMQWHIRDLKNNDSLRRAFINWYFKHPANFKRNRVLRRSGWRLYWKWHYNAWCSEFSSYVYKSAGMPVYYGKRQGFVAKNIARYQKVGWCVTKYSYFDDIFRNSGNWVPMQHVAKNQAEANELYVPQVGDYLRGKEHSMLILGSTFVDTGDGSPRKLKMYIAHGNAGSGAPEDNNKLMKVEYRYPTDSNLSGVGRMKLSTANE